MSDTLTEPLTKPASELTRTLRPELQRIIAHGRKSRPAGTGSLRAVAALTGISLVLLWLSFTPMQVGLCAWVALVPLIQLVRTASLPRRTKRLLWGMGFLWGVATLQWMRLGHPTMYTALFALALYVGLYFPVFVVISRRCVRGGLPVWLAIPIVWTALEFARAYLLTGFSWYYLGHSQYLWTGLTQISDVTGAYGVSFIVAAANAALAMQVPPRWLRKIGLDAPDAPPRGQLIAPVVAVVLIAASCIYGELRLQTPRPAKDGPVIALIQGNFTPDEKHDGSTIMKRYRRHEELTQYAAELQPDFIVWPETMFPWPMKMVADDVTDDELVESLPPDFRSQPGSDRESLISFWRSADVAGNLGSQSKIVGSALIVGLETSLLTDDGLNVYNSAAFIRPDLGLSGRYDKSHLVVFGEYIPLKDLFPWLSSFTPYGSGFGLEPGKSSQVFEYAGFRLAPLICFEDTVPHMVRRIVNETRHNQAPCDLLVNLTNDAWFRGSSELDQHLITASFRCIETRTPMVRAVNGGISAFIDGDGRVREPDSIQAVADEQIFVGSEMQDVSGMVDPATGRWRRQFSGIIAGQVPLDSRSSLYLDYGDWFCWLCVAATVLTVATGLRKRRDAHQDDSPQS